MSAYPPGTGYPPYGHTTQPPPQNPYGAPPVQGNYGYGGGGQGSSPPKKYIKVNGVMQLNPEYKRYQESQGKQATTVLYPDRALPVATNMDDHQQMRDASLEANYGDVPLSHATNATIEIMQQPDICNQVGLSSDAMVDELGRIFAKHEAPIGLMNKLLGLSEYDELEFIVDDSGSMNNVSDTKDAHGRQQTRWQEAHVRLKEMIEILAYVPTPKITIRFLNRRDVVEFHHKGEDPRRFIDDAYSKVDAAFRNRPYGRTPARERLEESFARGRGRAVSRYFFGDGEPNRGYYDQQRITEMVTKRENPKANPVTFLSCTGDDDQVEWMKEAEEIAPYCAEYDDFGDEAREVLRDQGKALPFTRGFHLIGQLVGAMNPDDLDAMDESIPFTKYMLDNLLGVQTSDQEYKLYFDGFLEAQRGRRIESKMDRVKQQFNWQRHYQDFVTAQVSRNIPAVQEFQRELARNKR